MPERKESPLFEMLSEGKADEFNAARAKGETIDLENAMLRGFNLRGVNLTGISLKGAYLSQADLRGLDLRFSNLDGATIKNAKISDCYFPSNVSPEEIKVSNELGIRIRVQK